MRAYVAGDDDAFAALFARYGGRVLARMRRAVGEAAARDLTQQTFLQLHRARNDFREDAALRPWLLTIARNVLRDHLRRVRRRPDELPLLLDPSGTDRATDSAEARAAVREAVAGLPESQRVVVRRQWLEHRSHTDIARELGISRGAVKVRAHRAYRALRRVLGAQGYEVG